MKESQAIFSLHAAQSRRGGNTVLQKAERMERDNEMRRLTRAFVKDQQWVMPAIHAAREELEGTDDVREVNFEEGEEVDEAQEVQPESGPVEWTSLYMPSELDPPVARTVPLSLRLEELRLRFVAIAQRKSDLCAQLQVRGTVNRWKVKNIHGQVQNTRAREKQTTIENNIAITKEAYRLHRARIVSLIAQLDEDQRQEYVPENWVETYQVLRDEDCRALSVNLLLQMEQAEMEHLRRIVKARNGGKSSGQSSHRISWIWYSVGEGEEFELNEGV